MITGCTHTVRYNSIDKFREEVEDEEAQIVLKDSTKYKGEITEVSTDSVSWYNPENKIVNSRLITDISSINTKSRARGIIDGLRTGFIVGSALGIMTVYGADVTFNYSTSFNFKLKYGIIIAGSFSLLGGFFGLVGGSIYKHSVSTGKMPELNSSVIKLEVSDDVLSIRTLLARKMHSEGFNVVSEGDADYKLQFLYNVDEDYKITEYRARITNQNTGRLYKKLSYIVKPDETLTTKEIIEKFIDQLLSEVN